MTTQQTDWIEYTASDEQIAELSNAKNGWICRFEYGTESDVLRGRPFINVSTQFLTHYWIISDDPLREMKVRQAMTGQPVWVRYIKDLIKLKPTDKGWREEIIVTTTPNWNIPNAEYSFTEFKD